MIKKRILVSLLSVALMLVSVPVQVQAGEGCKHRNLL